MKYYAHLSYSTKTKNKLQFLVHEFIKAHDKMLVSDVISFKKKVLETINSLNKANPRCTPIEPHWYSSTLLNDGRVYLHGLHFLSFALMPVLKYQSKEGILPSSERTLMGDFKPDGE